MLETRREPPRVMVQQGHQKGPEGFYRQQILSSIATMHSQKRTGRVPLSYTAPFYLTNQITVFEIAVY